ncbi:MAG: hypothetical protein OEW37_11750, partial [Rhodospirillaceae bacterium]|nr:hypothetical protein [Rhodospirillaceae bacterium]
MTIAIKNMPSGFYTVAQQMLWAMMLVFALGATSPYAQTQAESEYATKVLFMAVDKNDLPGVRAAIEGGANVEAVNPLGMQAVDIAVDRGYYDIAHYLISVRSQLAEKSRNNPAALSSAPQAPAEEWAARVTPPAQEEIAEAKPQATIADDEPINTEPVVAKNVEIIETIAQNENSPATPLIPQPRPTIAETSDAEKKPEVVEVVEEAEKPQPIEEAPPSVVAEAEKPQPIEESPPSVVAEAEKPQPIEETQPVAEESTPEQTAEAAPQTIGLAEPIEPEPDVLPNPDSLQNKVIANLPPINETPTISAALPV